MADFHYYGRITDDLPKRSYADDLLRQNEAHMLEEIKEMEKNVKRHITECKREVIKEVQHLCKLIKPKKDLKHGRTKKEETE